MKQRVRQRHQSSTSRYRPWAIVLFVVALAMVITTIPGASLAQSPIVLTDCQTITTSGSYLLQNDVSSTGTCFSIRTGNVTFNGNGKTISVATGDAVEAVDFSNNDAGFQNVSVSNFSSPAGVRTYGNNIDGVIFQQLTVEGITIYGSDDVTITNNIVGQGGIQVNNADRNGWYPLRPVVTNNTVTGGATDVKILLEIAGGSAHPCPRIDGQVTGNTITDTRNDKPPEATAAVRIRCATNTIFTHNTIRSTGTTIGLYMRDESDNGDYEDNTIWVNQEEALRIATGNDDKTWPSNNVFRNNTFRSDAGPTMYFQGIGHNNLFQNNIFWSGTDAWTIVGGAHGNAWDHNTFYVSGTAVVTLFSYWDGPPPDSWTNNIFDYSGSAVFTFDGWLMSPYSGDRNIFYNRSGAVSFGSLGADIATWRTRTNADANSMTKDPLFVDPANGDFHLQANSPARGVGNAASDIGALPYTVGCSELWSCGTWSACSGGQQTRICADGNSCGTIGYQPRLTESCDVTLPTVTLTSPGSGVFNGTITLTATASDNYAVGAVEFEVDGVIINGDQRYAPYHTTWDSTTLTDGNHTITAVARDAAGNQQPSAPVTITTNNGISCIENWSCGSWSTCTSGLQSRNCTDAQNCGTSNTKPVTSQSCASGSQCGAACGGCTANNILGSACTTARRQCDGTNSVENITLSGPTVVLGQPVTVTIDYACYATDDNLALWYYNGTTWRLIQSWNQGTLTNCSPNPGDDGNRSATFTTDGNAGSQYVRAIEGAGIDAGDPLASASSCPNLHWGNIDDMALTVTTSQTCVENWSCDAWSDCVHSSQSRTCTDLAQCGSTTKKPIETQACQDVDHIPPAAVQNLNAI